MTAGAQPKTPMEGPSVKTPQVETKVQQKVQRVPIGSILFAEFETLKIPLEKRKEIVSKYEEYVKGLMNCVSVWLGFGEAAKADPEKLAEAVRKANERELFGFLSDVFRKDFKASLKEKTLVVISMKKKKFNCYSATVLLADVLTRLGKEVTIIIAPGHVLLRGEKYALETTIESEFGVYAKEQLEIKYPMFQEIGVETLLSITYNWCGVTLRAMGRYKEALESLDKAIELNLKDAEIWYNRGITLHAMRRYDEALESYNKAIELNPNFVKAWNNKGFTLYSMGRYKEALESYNKAIELNPEKVGAWYNKGKTLYAMRRYKEALESYNKAIELNPKDARAWYNRGNVFRAMRRYEEALESYNKAIELNPNFVEARFNRALFTFLVYLEKIFRYFWKSQHNRTTR